MQKHIVYDGKYLQLVKQDNWEFVQRKNISGIVGIVAVTHEKKLILVEQFRVPVGKNGIEIPAGLAGDSADSSGESLEAAAARELEEETGYRAGTMTRIASGTASAGLADEIITIFVANDLTKVHDGKLDPSEKIQ